MPKNKQKHFVLCVRNDDAEDLDLRKVYEVLPDRKASQDGYPVVRRQTVIVSVLESLRQHLFTFTLSSVIEEIGRWFESGRSCFARLAEKLGLTGCGFPADGRPSLLDRVIPVPSG